MTVRVAHESGELVTETLWRLRSGQLWRWMFMVNDGAWPFQRVTEISRTQLFVGSHVIIKRGEVFTVMTVDDPGPYRVITPHVDQAGGSWVYDAVKRWHVALFNDSLVWVEHEWFKQSELVTDVV